ncbi:unnamed protein product [marine sediment metagenome]|uniref:Acylneuraminate cytidylyltransferase n=1 Tax=marine sediment metagenome TaxID=412755 RepID=X1FRW5_9ZZZZ
MKNILIICQARFSSTRLPGKVLKQVREKSILFYVIKRLELIKRANLIIAIGDSNTNKPIIDFCKIEGVDYFIGSEDDVLDRYY